MFLNSLNFWLWAAAALLCFAYVMAGFMKATRPIPALAEMMKWPGDYPPRFTRFIGMVDLLGGIGIVLPLATGILAWLSPVAAICLVVLQVLAIGFHLKRGETQVVPANIVLLLLAAFVAWGRLPVLGF
ncbi:MAG: DoxX family protein [Devosia sp.]